MYYGASYRRHKNDLEVESERGGAHLSSRGDQVEAYEAEGNNS